jgi:hypothetical protein
MSARREFIILSLQRLYHNNSFPVIVKQKRVVSGIFSRQEVVIVFLPQKQASIGISPKTALCGDLWALVPIRYKTPTAPATAPLKRTSALVFPNFPHKKSSQQNSV